MLLPFQRLPTSDMQRPGQSAVRQNVFNVAQGMYEFQRYVKQHSNKFENPVYLDYCLTKYCKFMLLQSELTSSPALVPTPAVDICFQCNLIRPNKFALLHVESKGQFQNATRTDRVDQGISFAPHTDAKELKATAEVWQQRWGEAYGDLDVSDLRAIEQYTALTGVDSKDQTVLRAYKQECSLPTARLLQDDQVMYDGFNLQNDDFYGPDGAPSIKLAAAYQRFLKWVWFVSQSDHTAEDFVPVGLTDFVWHAHMMQPRKYAEFSRLVTGREYGLDHDPLPVSQTTVASDDSKESKSFTSIFGHSLFAPLDYEIKQLNTIHPCAAGDLSLVCLQPNSAALVCDVCEMTLTEGMVARWNCPVCDFDLCLGCVPAQHPLHPCTRPLEKRSSRSIECDKCAKNFSHAELHCDACDWDLCRECAPR
jgi:hypothetical protein